MRRYEAWKGHGEVAFDPQPPPTVAYEPKACEMCPRTFLRQVGSAARYCNACLRLPQMAPPTLSAMNPARDNGSSLGPVHQRATREWNSNSAAPAPQRAGWHQRRKLTVH